MRTLDKERVVVRGSNGCDCSVCRSWAEHGGGKGEEGAAEPKLAIDVAAKAPERAVGICDQGVVVAAGQARGRADAELRDGHGRRMGLSRRGLGQLAGAVQTKAPQALGLRDKDAVVVAAGHALHARPKHAHGPGVLIDIAGPELAKVVLALGVEIAFGVDKDRVVEARRRGTAAAGQRLHRASCSNQRCKRRAIRWRWHLPLAAVAGAIQGRHARLRTA